MAHPQIAVFARLADGNETRIRAIEGQSTLLGRTMHAIAYDPIHDEILVPQQFGQGILVFRGSASGEEPPIRVIRGPKTQLIALDRLAVDPVNDEIFVPEGEKVLVFPRDANGDVAPKRVLTGPATRIGAARSVAIDTPFRPMRKCTRNKTAPVAIIPIGGCRRGYADVRAMSTGSRRVFGWLRPRPDPEEP